MATAVTITPDAAPAAAPVTITPDQGQDEQSLWGKVKSYFANAHEQAAQFNKDAQSMTPKQFAEAHPETVQAPSAASEAYADVKAGNYAKAIHRTVTSLGEGLAPLALTGGVVPAVAGAAIGTGLSTAGKAAGQAVGMTPDQADVAGDVTGIAGGLAAGYGANKLMEARPSINMAEASKTFNSLRGEIGGHTVEVTPDIAGALEELQQADATGANAPPVIKKFVTRIADTDQPPLSYDEARQFYSNVSDLAASDRMASNRNMLRLVNQFRGALGDAIETTADKAGRLSDYQDAMGQWHSAMTNQERIDAAKSTGGKYLGRALLGGTIYGGYRALRSILGGE